MHATQKTTAENALAKLNQFQLWGEIFRKEKNVHNVFFSTHHRSLSQRPAHHPFQSLGVSLIWLENYYRMLRVSHSSASRALAPFFILITEKSQNEKASRMKKCFLNCNFILTQNGEMGQRTARKNNNIHVKNDRNLSLNSISAPSSSSQQRVDSRRHEQRRKTHFSCVHTKHSLNFFEWVLGSACNFEEFSMLAQVNFNSLSTLTLNLQPASSVEMKTRNDLLLRYWAFSRIT